MFIGEVSKKSITYRITAHITYLTETLQLRQVSIKSSVCISGVSQWNAVRWLEIESADDRFIHVENPALQLVDTLKKIDKGSLLVALRVQVQGHAAFPASSTKQRKKQGGLGFLLIILSQTGSAEEARREGWNRKAFIFVEVKGAVWQKDLEWSYTISKSPRVEPTTSPCFSDLTEICCICCRCEVYSSRIMWKVPQSLLVGPNQTETALKQPLSVLISPLQHGSLPQLLLFMLLMKCWMGLFSPWLHFLEGNKQSILSSFFFPVIALFAGVWLYVFTTADAV